MEYIVVSEHWLHWDFFVLFLFCIFYRNPVPINYNIRGFTFEASLIKQFNHCNAIAADILDNNKSKEIQEYAKKFAEIESPLVGGTEAEWIRINWGDIYIFLCDDGNIRYQVDPLGEYGGELIDMWNCEREDFIKAILSLEEPPIIRDGVTIYESADPIEEPDLYVPMKQRKNISPTKNRLRERALR